MKKKKKSNEDSTYVVIRPVIEDIEGKYRLYTVKHEGKIVPILDINGQAYDAGDFITVNLYNTVDSYLNSKTVTDDLVSVIEDIPLSDFFIVFEVLKKGKELGFFKN